MFFTPNLVIGITIMSVGAVLLLDTLGIRDAASMLKFWPALIVLFGLSIVAQAFRPATDAVGQKRANGGVPCFFLFLLAVAMFGSFNNFPFGTEVRALGDQRASATSVMGNSSTKVSGDVRHGRVAAVMGKSSLDLRQVTLKPGDVMTVDVFVTMGRATVRIPDGWIVDSGALPVMGSVDEERFPPPSAPGTPDEQPKDGQAAAGPLPAPPTTTGPPPRLRLRGFVMMGKVEVRS